MNDDELRARAVAYVQIRAERAHLVQEMQRCRCTEESSRDYENGDPGKVRCYRGGPDEEGNEWCEACRKRQALKNEARNLSPKLQSAWGKLKRAAAPSAA